MTMTISPNLVILCILIIIFILMFYSSEIGLCWERRNKDGVDYTRTKLYKKRYSIIFTKEKYYVTQDEHDIKKDGL